MRFGTSGSLQADIPVDSFVLSSHGLGMDNMFHSYKDSPKVREIAMEEVFIVIQIGILSKIALIL